MKYKTLITELNEERIRSNMEKLEQKYKKIYGNSINYESKVGSTRSAIRWNWKARDHPSLYIEVEIEKGIRIIKSDCRI